MKILNADEILNELEDRIRRGHYVSDDYYEREVEERVIEEIEKLRIEQRQAKYEALPPCYKGFKCSCDTICGDGFYYNGTPKE